MRREWIRLRHGPGTREARFPGFALHCAWGGRYELCLDGRALALDDDVIVLSAPGRCLRGAFRPGPAGTTLSILYPEGAARRALAAQPLRAHAGDAGWRVQGGDVVPPEHIRTCPPAMRLLLREVARQLDAGLKDPAWFEEQAQFLLERLLADDLRAAAARAQARRRRASAPVLLGRLHRITDLIHSEYERPLSLEELARAAHLSPFHMLRRFKALHGMTPHAFLQRRRLSAALRLLRTTGEPVSRIAERVGFADRRTLKRLAQRTLGQDLDALRRR